MSLASHDIPEVFFIKDYENKLVDIPVSVIRDNTSSSGIDTFIDFSFYNIDNQDLIDNIMEFVTIDQMTGDDDSCVEVIVRDILTQFDNDFLIELWISLKNTSQQDIKVSFFLNSYLVDFINDTNIDFRINIGTLPTNLDTDLEIYISGVTWYKYLTDIYCCTEADILDIESDIQQDLGRLASLSSDIYSSVSGINYINNSVYNSAIGVSSYYSELTTLSGNITAVENDIFSSCLIDLVPHYTEIKIKSLFIGDFFLEVDNYTTASSIAWIDIVDYLYPIDINNTNLYVDGVLASGIYFDDIPNGYRMYYNSIDDFYSTGELIYTVHSESSIGEVDEKNFYLLYGYDLFLDEPRNWEVNKKIIIRAEAKNLAFCPNLESDAFYFVTKDLSSFNLGCTIIPVGYEDLPTSIYPQSTAFFYGKTYIVTLKNIKDLAGNIMQDFEYVFTIEDI